MPKPISEPIGEYCLCSHAREAHNLDVRNGRKVRTKCSHAACGCREHRPDESVNAEPTPEG